MIPILFESDEYAFNSNGLGRLRDCISCTVTEERNGIFECDFEYPVTGAHYDDIIEGRIVYVIHDDTGIPQPFDIIGSTKPMSGIVTFHAVHISYRLCYLVLWGTGITSLDDAIEMLYNAAPNNRFDYSTDFSSTGFAGAFDGTPRTVRQVLGGIEGSILDTYGGELEFDLFSVRLKKARGVQRDFSIRYGINLLDYNEETDFSGVYTSCYPFWHGQNEGGQEVTVIGSKVSADAPSYTGREMCIPLDLSEKFETKPTTSQVEAMARSVMHSRQVSLPARTIRVDFVSLQDMPEFAQFERLLECNLCDTIGVEFPRYGMSGDFKIVKTVYNVLKERYDEMELGALSTSLSEALGIGQGTPKEGTVEDLALAGDISAGGSLKVYNGQQTAQFETSGTSTYSYVELIFGGRVLRLVSNVNGNIGLYDPAAGKWIIRNDTNGATYLAGRSTPFGAILAGTLASTSVAGGTYKDTAITFPEAFDTVPTVVCSISSTSTSTDIGSMTAAAINVTATGFTIRIFNNSANTRAPAVPWVAYA